MNIIITKKVYKMRKANQFNKSFIIQRYLYIKNNMMKPTPITISTSWTNSYSYYMILKTLSDMYFVKRSIIIGLVNAFPND